MTNEEVRKIEKLAKTLSVKLSNIGTLKEALIHRSYVNEAHEKISNNERLEFLGDAVLEIVVTEFLFEKYTNFPEGQLTSLRAALVKTESLAEEADRLGVGEYIYMSKGEEATGGRKRPYILANTMEAIIGAIYLDRGMLAARKFIIKNICYKVKKIIEERLDVDSKSYLQEISQEKLKITPSYLELSSFGPDHDKRFEMAVMIDKFEFGKGVGKNKQQAEQAAAMDAIKNWEKLEKKYFS